MTKTHTKQEIEVFYPSNTSEWRAWLEQNHVSKQAVWLVYYTKKSQKETISWSEAVDGALCYGWIDSKRIKIDEITSHQYFSKRKPKSTWSKINKEKVQQLIADGLMTKAGFDSIEIAKKNGSWTILDDIEELIIPDDFEKELEKHEGTKDYFLSLGKSIRKILLYRIKVAKRPETRQKRMDEIVESLTQRQIPK